MNMKKTIIFSIILLVIMFGINIFLFPNMPDRIVTHWNSAGVPNGSMGKFWGLFLFPIITLGIFLLFLALPIIDPLKKNIQEFTRYYDSFILLIIFFFFYADIVTILWNMGLKLNINFFIIPAIGFLFIYLGAILKHIKQNWFIGIRTPWTLSSKIVWEKTHLLGGKLFIISGIITLIGLFFPSNLLIWFILSPIIISAVWLFIYSYLEFRKLEKKL